MCKFLSRPKFSTSLDNYQMPKLLNHVVRICLVEKIAKLYFKVAVPFCIPTSDGWEILFVHILASIGSWWFHTCSTKVTLYKNAYLSSWRKLLPKSNDYLYQVEQVVGSVRDRGKKYGILIIFYIVTWKVITWVFALT